MSKSANRCADHHRHHLILATIADEPQTGLLQANDLEMAYACVCAWEDTNAGSLFAFFNSGEHSGASQPHRHIQFLPVEEMSDNQQQWHMLHTTMKTPRHNDKNLLCNEDLPFIHFAASLSSEMSVADLHETYLCLLTAVLINIGGLLNRASTNSSDFTEDAKVVFSYNLAMTKDMMAILPRRSEGSRLPDSRGSLVSINGTILAGTTMVKSEDDWHILQKRPDLLRHIFSDIAYEISTQQVDHNL